MGPAISFGHGTALAAEAVEFIQGFGKFKIPHGDHPAESDPAESSHGAT